MSDHYIKEKIIYIYPQLVSVIKKDLQFLADNYRVVSPDCNWTNKKMIVFNFLYQFFYLLKEIMGSKSVFVKFGGYWSFLPCVFGKIFGKPVFIILGGTDCVSIPELNYGSLRKTMLRFFIRLSYTLSTRLVPVANSLVETDYTYFPECKYPKQGYKYFFPKIKTPNSVVYNGFNTEIWRDKNIPKKRNTFITVANINSPVRFKLKGIDMMLELAQEHEDCNFTVIGMDKGYSETLRNVPGNVVFYEFIPSDQLPKFLNESEFYLQLSISEGFPNALCEGMLCECIPVGSNVGAIPEIISDSGIVVQKRDFNIINEAVKKLISMDVAEREKLAKRARQKITENFGIEKRKRAFFSLIETGK